MVTIRALRCSREKVRPGGKASFNQWLGICAAVLQRVLETSKLSTRATASRDPSRDSKFERESGPRGELTPIPVTRTRLFALTISIIYSPDPCSTNNDFRVSCFHM